MSTGYAQRAHSTKEARLFPYLCLPEALFCLLCELPALLLRKLRRLSVTLCRFVTEIENRLQRLRDFFALNQHAQFFGEGRDVHFFIVDLDLRHPCKFVCGDEGAFTQLFFVFLLPRPCRGSVRMDKSVSVSLSLHDVKNTF